MQPTHPTGQPTSQPSFDENDGPRIYNTGVAATKTYWCHPSHLHSTPNLLQNVIFGNITLSTKVAIKKAVIQIAPYDPTYDQYGMIGNDYGALIVTTFVDNGDGTARLEIFNVGQVDGIGDPLSIDGWNHVLQFTAYRLGLQNGRPLKCLDIVGRTITFSVQFYDNYGRSSNTISSTLVVKTSLLLFTEQIPVHISDKASRTSINLDAALYPNSQLQTGSGTFKVSTTDDGLTIDW
jgi:hypothetical protein